MAEAQYLRQCLTVVSVLEVEEAADDAPPLLFLVLVLSGSGVKAPATDGQVEATTLRCHTTRQPLHVWRGDAATVTVFMLDGAVQGNLLELTTLDKLRWRNMVVSDSFGCWDPQHKERAIPTLVLEDTKCSVIRWMGAIHWRAGAQT